MRRYDHIISGSRRSKRNIVFLAWLIFSPSLIYGQVIVPSALVVTGYDSHIELQWQASPTPGIITYNIYRSGQENGPFTLVHQAPANRRHWIDFTGRLDTTLFYRVTAQTVTSESPPTTIQTGNTSELSDDALLDMVQRYTFRYFWDLAHPVSGLARERTNSGDVVTTGGSGFGIMAIPIAVERGYISRQDAILRMIQITSFLEIRAQRYHGAFAHWLNGNTGTTIPFSQFDDGGDLVETAFLMQGLLTARAYFNQQNPLENSLRASITRLWEEVEWSWYRRNNSNVLYWHWSPLHQWTMNFQLRGFNEVMITYLLGIASPTHGIPASLYHTGWAAGNPYVNTESYYGYPMLIGPFRGGPLFFAHYSYLGFDPRNKRDAYGNYFIRNRNHTLINRAYCIANPKNHAGYGPNSWGLTASDNPWGYLAHEPVFNKDNGTIAPTAALSSMPYTPEESMAALKHFYRNLGDRLWSYYGFYDAFNLGQNWVASSHLAIDQGPIIVMIENFRSGLPWNLFMSNPEIQPALDAIGFVPDATSNLVQVEASPFSFTLSPNPASDNLYLRIHSLRNEDVVIRLMDLKGVDQVPETRLELMPGVQQTSLSLTHLPKGIYLLSMQGRYHLHTERIVVY